ncbi:hypothetical protein [Actinomadura rubrisoli]|nr:hypothetical protein [Actinomadura rubrisoli]
MAIDPGSEWRTSDYMLAEIIDRLELNNWLLLEINSENNEIPLPEPYWRPGVTEAFTEQDQERTFATPREVANLFAGF